MTSSTPRSVLGALLARRVRGILRRVRARRRLQPRFGRHSLDRVARLVVSGERGGGGAQDRLADVVAGLMSNRLAAVGAAGARRARRTGSAARRAGVRLDRDILRRLVERTSKLLAAAALARDADARTRPR